MRGIGDREHGWQYSDDNDQGARDGFARMHQVKDRDERGKSPVDLLWPDQVHGSEHAENADDGEGDARSTHLSRDVDVASKRQESSDHDQVDERRKPFALHQSNHGERQDAKRAGGAQDQRQVGFDGAAAIVRPDDVPPGIHPRVQLLHGAPAESGAPESTEKSTFLVLPFMLVVVEVVEVVVEVVVVTVIVVDTRCSIKNRRLDVECF